MPIRTCEHTVQSANRVLILQVHADGGSGDVVDVVKNFPELQMVTLHPTGRSLGQLLAENHQRKEPLPYREPRQVRRHLAVSVVLLDSCLLQTTGGLQKG